MRSRAAGDRLQGTVGQALVSRCADEKMGAGKPGAGLALLSFPRWGQAP